MSERLSTGRTQRGGALLWVLIVAALGVAGYFLAPVFEWRAPVVNLTLTGDRLGLAPFEVSVSDEGRGLKQFTVSLQLESDAIELHKEQFADGVFEKTVTIDPSAFRDRIREGAARLTVTATDHSRWGWFKGNHSVVERQVTVDLTPPRVDVLSRQHYVNFGGSGMVVYRVTSDAVRSGVVIGDYFFPGYSGLLPGGDVMVALFAHPYDVDRSARPVVVAEDAAANRGQSGFYYSLKDRRYREREINVSDNFIQSKVLPLLAGSAPADPVQAYLKVNHDMRIANAETIRALAGQTSAQRLWSGPFYQLSNSKVEAQFADHRTYVYNGREIGKEYHLGFDLAATQRYPVEAANAGVVVFAENLGIYGNTVVIDHGLGLQTLYAHLSSIDVQKGDRIETRQVIGRSGETGLAGGDHLHYGVYINGVPVLPLEWWDDHWIQDNIEKKLREAGAELAASG